MIWIESVLRHEFILDRMRENREGARAKVHAWI